MEALDRSIEAELAHRADVLAPPPRHGDVCGDLTPEASAGESVVEEPAEEAPPGDEVAGEVDDPMYRLPGVIAGCPVVFVEGRDGPKWRYSDRLRVKCPKTRIIEDVSRLAAWH